MLKEFARDMRLAIINLRMQPRLRGASELTQWGRDKMAAIFQTTFSNGFREWKCMNYD